MEEKKFYLSIGNSFAEAEESQMFGKPCFKVNGKAFICFFEDCLVCKLSGTSHKAALALDGSELFDPSKKGRAMKEWVQIPYDYKSKWKKFAKDALEYVSAGK